jgi:hypothetical protein
MLYHNYITITISWDDDDILMDDLYHDSMVYDNMAEAAIALPGIGSSYSSTTVVILFLTR